MHSFEWWKLNQTRNANFVVGSHSAFRLDAINLNGVTVYPEKQITQALQKMQNSEVHRMLVIQNNLLRGIITANDVTKDLFTDLLTSNFTSNFIYQ
ncbi:CBS domain-containing protein [Nostocaceae cyanobacterium CENA357]|uniref:CBS domain-containing protein n=1 Tax=Atlanticothrix silvestris CENA357 TaxID=1725252 RepID=A0A8J7HPS0_9CYAN|nr:CBS domain-containing protein [Atlanticothrix silvestris CENA357]